MIKLEYVYDGNLNEKMLNLSTHRNTINVQILVLGVLGKVKILTS